jgi:hypothetical protein
MGDSVQYCVHQRLVLAKTKQINVVGNAEALGDPECANDIGPEFPPPCLTALVEPVLFFS